jgi:Tol biopolymer transport system component
MTTQRRASAELPEILGDLGRGPYPEYIANILASTARQRQRRVWMLLERWLPMDLVREPVLSPPLPWRQLTIAVILIVALIGGAVAVLSSIPKPLPAPFGPAANGLIAYETGGDIYVGDPASGDAKAIVTGSGMDTRPRFSLDGTTIVFGRDSGDGLVKLFLVGTDGSNLRELTNGPIALVVPGSGRGWEAYEFAPDGRSILVSVDVDGTPTIGVIDVETGDLRTLDTNGSAIEPSYRPPDGHEILYISSDDLRTALSAIDPMSGKIRPIVELPASQGMAGASWSPDGSSIAYWSWSTRSYGLSARTHIVNADGTGDRELPMPPEATWNAHASWSNDGMRLFTVRGYTTDFQDVRGFVQPARGSDPGFEVAPTGSVENECCAAWSWSPDDRFLLGRPVDRSAARAPQVLIDVEKRKVVPTPWSTTSDPTWQRRAP